MEELPRRPVLLALLMKLNPKPADMVNYDDVMAYVLDKAIADVANYTHVAVTDLPAALDNTIVAMAQQVIDTHQLLTPSEGQSGDVDSISEGDTSVKFKSAAQVYTELQAVNTISDNFILQLNSFRRVTG